jgi:hypothetical protein
VFCTDNAAFTRQCAIAGIGRLPLQAACVPALNKSTLDEFIFRVKQFASFGKYIFVF